MSVFQLAVQTVLQQEGGYNNDPDDKGKETKFGISKKAHPTVDIQNLTVEQATEIYQKEYWQKAFEQIYFQPLVNKTFSIGVDIGMQNAIICLQRAVRAVSGQVLVLDGVLGQISLKEINACEQATLLSVLKANLAAYYRALHNPKYNDGWENRAYA